LFPHRDPEIPLVNLFVDKSDYKTTWNDFNIVSSVIRNAPTDIELVLFDWAKAYWQIPTAASQWPYLMIKDFKGNLMLDTRITFGGVAGCRLFGRPADAWTKIMMNRFDILKIFRWVDDNLLIKRNTLPVSMTEVVEKSNELGVKTNNRKFTPFAEEQKFIGFIWNGKEKTICLPDGKLFDRVSQLKSFLTQDTFTYKDVEVLVGQLNHVPYILPQLRCYLCILYRWLKSWKIFTAEWSIPEDVQDNLQEWLHTLLTFTPARLMPNPAPTEIRWVGDALTSFGIGILIGSRWSQF
jgi:hypothetical protein